jgi:type II secretory pathway component PulC
MMKIALPLVFALAGCATHAASSTSTEVEEPTAEAPRTPEPVAKETAPDLKEALPPGTIARTELVRVLDAAPGRFLQHVQTEPRFVGGRWKGWRLASFFPGDARFANVDLRAGDVVLTVNGKSIEQPEQLMEVWEGLRFERALVVNFERDGQVHTLRFDIRD